MSDAFDPYYIWLGIPPEEQPPHHYRLLGVTLFEENSEVIEAAANRQMAYIQEISAGDDHIDQAQKIMGQLSKARVCLLNSEKKDSYDAKLRASFDTLDQASESTDASSTSAPTIATPNPPGGDGPLMPPQFGKTAGQEAPVTGVSQSQDGKTAKRSTRPASGKRKTKAPVRPGFLLAIIGLIAVVVAFVLFSGTPEDGSKVTQNDKSTQADEKVQKLEETVQKLKAAQQEAERKAKEKKEEEEEERKAKEKEEEEEERKAQEEVDRKAKEEVDRKAKAEADRKATEKKEEEEERKAQEEVDRKAKEEVDRKAKAEADRKATEKKELEAKGKKEDAAKAVLQKYDLELSGGFWEAKKQWKVYRDLSKQLTKLRKGKPIPTKKAIQITDAVRTQYETSLTEEIEALFTKYGKLTGDVVVFTFDNLASKARYDVLLRIADSRFHGGKKANKAEKDAAFYEWAFKQPQFKPFFVIPSPPLIAEREKKISKAIKNIRQRNKILTKKTEVATTLDSLGQTLRPAP